MGIHITGFDILIESWDNNEHIETDLERTLEFLEEIHNLTKTFSAVDTMDR